MATVYLAQDVRHDRKVALKVLRPELSAVLGAERFLAEIKTTANLQHPHILSLFDSGEADGTVFYVMPFVEGESLRDRIKREQQLPIDDAVRVAREVLDALEYAHQHGIVHRDIKPENILLHGGHAMVADFGIALAASKVDGGTRMTETGMSLGTPHYMSPEQAMGERIITGKADIYALGCVLYEMLSGDPPFTGSSAQAVFARVLTDEPRSLTLQRKTIPPNVEAAVSMALQKLPADRFATAAQFAEALAKTDFRLAATRTARAIEREISWRQKATRALPWALFVAAGGLAIAGWLGRPTPAVSRQRTALWNHSVAPGSFPYEIALSPDGRTIVYVDTVGGPRQLWSKDQNEIDPRPLTGTVGGMGPTFSPNGEWIAFVADGKVKVVPRLGGSARTIADTANVQAPVVAWLDNGTVAYNTPGYALRSVSEDGGPTKVVVRVTAIARGVVAATPLPEGRGLLLTTCTPGCRDADLKALDLRTGELRNLGDEIVKAWFTPAGDVVFVRRDGGVFTAPFDLNTMAFKTAPVPVLDGVRASFGSADMVLSPNGTVIYIRGSGQTSGELHQAVWVDRTGRASPVEAGWNFTSRSGLTISPDGNRLAVPISAGPASDVWIRQLDKGTVTRATFTGVNERARWTADGRSILFISAREGGNEDVRSRRADGTGSEETGLDHARPIHELEPTPDTARWIVRLGGQPSRDLFLWRRGSDLLTPLVADSAVSESGPALSPDGRWLAYVSNESGRPEVFVRPYPNVNSGRWQISRNGATQPLWAHSGRELFFRDVAGMLVAVTVRPGTSFETGEQRSLFSVTDYLSGGVSFRSYDVTPDDRRFLFLRSVASASSGSGGPPDLVRIDNWFSELRAKRR